MQAEGRGGCEGVAQCHMPSAPAFCKVILIMAAGRYSLESTPDEDAFGFSAIESPTGERVLVVVLASGLRAVKALGPDGSTEYVVCNERLEPLYATAKTLEELRERFVRRSGYVAH